MQPKPKKSPKKKEPKEPKTRKVRVPKEPKPKKSPKKKEPKEPKTRKVRDPKQKPLEIKEDIENINYIIDEIPKEGPPEQSIIQKTPENIGILEPVSQPDIPKNEIIIIKKNKTKKNKEPVENKSPKSPKKF